MLPHFYVFCHDPLHVDFMTYSIARAIYTHDHDLHDLPPSHGGEWSLLNAKNLSRILTCFHLALGLKVNFHESKLFGVGVTNSEVNSLASTIGCLPSHFPCTYLGLPIGGNRARCANWSILGLDVLIGVFLSKSGPWFRIAKLKEDLCKVGIDLPIIFKKNNWKWTNTRFWRDNWLGGSPLKVDFPRLFRLDSNLQCLVCNRSPTFHPLASTHVAPDFSVTRPLPQTGLEFHWAWRRPIRSGPKSDELTTLCDLVAQLRLTGDIDLWECTVDDTRIFTVKGMRSHIINTTSPPPTTSSPTRWNNLIPLKVNVFTWKTANQRLPTRSNLDFRGIDLHSVLCPLCEEVTETEEHIFVSCGIAKEIWKGLVDWWNIHRITVTCLTDAINLADMVPLTAAAKMFFDTAVQATLWRFRNETIRNLYRPTKRPHLDDIKLLFIIYLVSSVDKRKSNK
ncbi:RNA-directed DNA polymerase, eukaryota, reverse transcriptase zinc-binding domain protein [Tanacetum coccineum]